MWLEAEDAGLTAPAPTPLSKTSTERDPPHCHITRASGCLISLRCVCVCVGGAVNSSNKKLPKIDFTINR